MKRLGGSDSFTGSIIMRILLILLARISVGLEEKDITGKASGENNFPVFHHAHRQCKEFRISESCGPRLDGQPRSQRLQF